MSIYRWLIIFVIVKMIWGLQKLSANLFAQIISSKRYKRKHQISLITSTRDFHCLRMQRQVWDGWVVNKCPIIRHRWWGRPSGWDQTSLSDLTGMLSINFQSGQLFITQLSSLFIFHADASRGLENKCHPCHLALPRTGRLEGFPGPNY